MILVDDVLISEAAAEARFGCRLEECLGACCRVGDAGAPLGDGESAAIRGSLDCVRPLLPRENLELLDGAGFVQTAGPDAGMRKEMLTCFPDGRCIFSVRRRPAGPLSCALEEAFRAGSSGFRKPLFCHLFPLRMEWFYGRRALNVERRPECEPGWDVGPSLIEFSREALARVFGQDWAERAVAAVRAASDRGGRRR